ncbi:MAG: hypothetical protein HON70_17015, partial [Lentisphaerae bacterium]|nr:hypothetical protein [Lentisphaerota bacterium]
MTNSTPPGSLIGTQVLPVNPDPAGSMVDGIHRFLDQATDTARATRAAHWARDLSSHEAYTMSTEPNRTHLAEIIGAADPRLPVVMSTPLVPRPSRPNSASQSGRSCGTARAVAWTVMEGVTAEGLLLEPDGHAHASVIALPDCDTPPEALAGLVPGVPERAQFARHLVGQGCRVLIPTLISRACTHSGLPGIKMTNMPHRELIYRAAFELGHHVVGYEVQKILAAVDWFTGANSENDASQRPIGVIGYGEGGLLAFYAAALDERISATAVLGYFAPREALWQEPIYRNVFGLLEAFGDAEIASLIAPRALVVEACACPAVDAPSTATKGRSAVAASGRIDTPPAEAVAAEIHRARELTQGLL